MIRLANLQRRAASTPELEARVSEVLRSGRFIGGPVVTACEQEAARRFGRAAAVGVGSGTDALILAFLALDLGPGDEIAIPAISFFATAGAVIHAGATPLIVDVDDQGLLDPIALDAARSGRTRAVVPVHLFGAVCRFSTDLVVVDDAAQAVGARGGAWGALTAVSAYPTKTWGAAGDAGFVLGDDRTLLDRVRALGHHGMVAPHEHEAVGATVGRNCRIDAIQAAVLLAQAPEIDRRITRRREIAARYDASLPADLRPVARGPDHPVHQYVIRCQDRARWQARFAEADIETAVYYPRPLADQPALRGRVRAGPCPNAARFCDEALALPVDDALTDAEVDAVVATLERR
jgi:dTDP-4-amino-4,6-dideoxygalactose transaminase